MEKIYIKKHCMEISLFNLLRWSYVQLNVDAFLLSLTGIISFVVVITTWNEPNRYLILGVNLFIFSSFLLGTIASYFLHLSIKKNGKPKTIWVFLSLFFWIFGWSLSLTWLIFKPKVVVDYYSLVGKNLGDLQKIRKNEY